MCSRYFSIPENHATSVGVQSDRRARRASLAHLILVMIGAAAASAACGSANGPPVPRNHLARDIAESVCRNVQGCCAEASLDFDPYKCKEEASLPFITAINDAQLGYNDDEAARCVKTVGDVAAACQAVVYSLCASVFTGGLPPGASCTTGFDCAPGKDGYATCVVGRCVQPKRGLYQEPCSYNCPVSGQCTSIFTGNVIGAPVACYASNGLNCVQDNMGVATCQSSFGDCRKRPVGSCPPGRVCEDGTGACVPAIAVGGDCTKAACVPGAYCGGVGVCAPLRPISAPCDDSRECESGRCDGSFCTHYSPAAATLCHGVLAR